MPKKRTRAQKIKAQNKFQPFIYSLKSFENELSASNVKGQFEKSENTASHQTSTIKSSIYTEDISNLKLIKKELIKSLIVSSLILCLIAMIYLLWN